MPPDAPSYQEHRPHPALSSFVECYWSFRARLGRDAPLSKRVLPDGCMDILFDLSPDGEARVHPRVIGTMLNPLDVTHAGEVRLFGVRFKPGGARPWSCVPSGELTDRHAWLADIWGSDALDLQERLMAVTPGKLEPTLVDRILMDRLERADAVPDEAVLRASRLATLDPQCTVDAMARASGLGRRQLERRFHATVGVTPKTFSRIARFRRAANTLHADPAADLSRVAHGAGYADQPHFTREFRAFSGTTPGDYRSLCLAL